ncbi:Monocarboxylate 2-oxoacid-binding periplasmic protein [subsurface metagenome]
MVTWKSSGHGPAADKSQVYHDRWAAAVTEASGGRLVIKSFVGGSVAPATEELDAVDKGTLQSCFTCPMYNQDKWAASGLISSRPGGLAGECLRVWFNYGGGADLMNKMMGDFNVMTLPGALSPLPPEIFAHSTVPIRSLDDIEGLKMRTAGDGGAILTAMGASVVFLPGGEIVQAMQTGVIEAFEYSTPALNWDMAFQEIAKYVIFSEVRAPSDPQVFFVNRNAWADLPDDLKLLVQGMMDKWTQAEHEFLVYNDIAATQRFIDYGCEVSHLPADVESTILAEAKKFYDGKAAKEPPIFKEMLESMRAFKKAYGEQKALNTPLATE